MPLPSPLDSAVHGKWKVVDHFSFRFFLKIREYWGQRAELIQMENISKVEWVHSIQLISSVQSLSHVQLFVTPWIAGGSRTPGFPIHHQLLELAQIHVH